MPGYFSNKPYPYINNYKRDFISYLLIGAFVAIFVRRLRGKIKEDNYWLIAHIRGMLASYIGAITAFTVNNNRWMHLPVIVAWLGPTIVLIPFILSQTSSLKKSKLQQL